MEYIIDPHTYEVLEPLWYSEKYHSARNGYMEKIHAWPVGIMFPGFDQPHWTFTASLENRGTKGWKEEDLHLLYALLSEKNAGPGWIFLKGLAPPWLAEAPYIALYPPIAFIESLDRYPVQSFGSMYTSLTGKGYEYFFADTVAELSEQVGDWLQVKNDLESMRNAVINDYKEKKNGKTESILQGS